MKIFNEITLINSATYDLPEPKKEIFLIEENEKKRYKPGRPRRKIIICDDRWDRPGSLRSVSIYRKIFYCYFNKFCHRNTGIS
jgi:hypothetical protein